MRPSSRTYCRITGRAFSREGRRCNDDERGSFVTSRSSSAALTGNTRRPGNRAELLSPVDVEEATLRAFIRKTRVERHVALLRTPSRRAKLIAQFYDLDLDPRFV